jgi:HK97 family phage major capsid protein/HK97 family phage prohead protease
MKRAYSQLTIKAIDEDQRIIEGIATTPSPDRLGDIVEPEGAEFKLPIPLLMGHDSMSPIGHVIAAKVSKDGIEIRAKLVKIDEPGNLKERLDESWQSIKSGLVRGLSIGFRSLESAQIKDTWSEHFLKWMWLELSAVVIPANVDASITAIKQVDRDSRAASGELRVTVVRLAGESLARDRVRTVLNSVKGNDMKTIAEQIAALEAKRAASAARREEIQSKAIDEGRTKDEAEREEFTTLSTEIKAIDDELVDLKLMESQAVSKAKPVRSTVERPDDVDGAAELRGSGPITVQSNVPKGIAFARYVKAMINGQGNPTVAHLYAKGQRDWQTQTPQVAEYIKTAIEGGDTTTSGWASEWVYNQNLVGEFIELLRPMTVIGKLGGLRRVPFNVRVSGQDSGSTAYWIGQGKAIPVSKLNSIEVTLGIAKAAGLVVLTRELVMSSDPSAEMKVRDDLLGSITEFLDRQFLDPTVAAVSNVSPASITNGVTDLTPTGTGLSELRADVQTLFRNFINVNDDPTSASWILDTSQALAISMMQNALGQNEFPTLTMQGGTWFGLPAVVSNSANVAGSPDSGRMIILAKQSDIMLAEGGLEIDASREASIEMTDVPTGDAAAGTAGTTSLVSMFQSESVAVKAIRFANWKKKRSTAVAYIGHAAYVA